MLSLAIHGTLAAALVAFGLSIETPAVQGEQVVSVVMLRDAPADEAAGDAASPAAEAVQTLALTAGLQVREEESPAEPALEPEPAMPVYPPKPDVPPVAAAPLLAAPTPAKASVPEPTPLPPVETAKPEAPKPMEAAKPQVQKAAPPEVKPTLLPLAKARSAVEKPKPVPKTKPEESSKPEAKAKPEKKVAAAAKPDAKGDKASAKTGKHDARKGQMDRSEKGTATKISAGKASSGTGNAKASNYPGLVQRRIARTRQKPSFGKGSVVVSFSVTASGSLAGVSIARSSGNAAADAAAVDHIRRSAPFPAPPDGAQTRFQIPVAIR